MIIVAPIAGRASDRFGSRGLITAGMLLLSCQLLYFSQLGPDATFWTLLPGLVLGGIGMSMTMTPSTAAATRAVPVEKAGVGAPSSTPSARWVARRDRPDGGDHGRESSPTPPTAASFMDGFESALLVAAAIALVGAIVAAILIRPHDTTRGAEEELQAAEAA